MQHSLIKAPISISREILGISCMLLMVHAYGFAPLQPTLTREFSSALMQLAIPVFAIFFAFGAAAIAFLHAIVRLEMCFKASLICLCAGSVWLSLTTSAEAFLLTRALTGLGTGIMLPSALMLASTGVKKAALSDLIMILFALAAGITFGPSLGGWLNSLWGWRFLYRGVGIIAALLVLFTWLSQYRQAAVYDVLHRRAQTSNILKTVWKGRYIYTFVYLTAVFHSGVFVWISHYFTSQYGQDEYHIANDLMIFGLPGLVITFLLYRYHLDTKVLRILYAGLTVTIAGMLALMTNLPLWLAECLLAVMSIGFGCSQPIFIGILRLPSTVSPIAIGCCILFAGYGSGPLMMIALLDVHLGAAMIFLIILMILLALVSRLVWRQPAVHAKRRRHVHVGLYSQIDKQPSL